MSLVFCPSYEDADGSWYLDKVAIWADYDEAVITERKGTASITGAVNSVDVTHNLPSTPARVFVTARQTGQGDYAVTARGATTFTITFATQPGASTWYFDWKAEV